MSWGTGKIMSAVEPLWRVWPFTRHSTVSASIASPVTTTGPTGQKVSMPFARVHWPSFFWRSRAVMSPAIVQPKIAETACAGVARRTR
jgi:hypothetical protein